IQEFRSGHTGVVAMRTRGIRAAGVVVFAAAVVVGPAGGDEPKATGPAATITDTTGKDIALTAVRFTTGVRRLGWLGGPKDAQLALEVREPNSTTYQKGVLTLIPVASVEAVRYEY